MARRVKDKALDTREARSKLKPRGKPYWRAIERGLHLGYRRLAGRAGSWCTRCYLGNQSYEVEALGIADDLSDADGVAVLDFWQAQAKARSRLVQHANGTHAGPITVRDVVEDYLEWLTNNRKSAKDARYRMEAFVYPTIGNIVCAKLTADMIRKWHSGLAKAPPRQRTGGGEIQRHFAIGDNEEAIRKRRSSANRVLVMLRAALNRAWREGKIPSDAEWKRVQAFQNVDVARTRYLTIAEAQRLANACEPAFRPLLQAALQTGARYGELIRLEARDFNADAGTIAIRQSKSGKARHIILTDEGAALFKQFIIGKAGTDLLFQRPDGTPFRRSAQQKPMDAACARAKIKPHISFHGLRHTWASLAVMNGVPLVVVAKNLGHTSTRMVEQHYGHLSPSFVTEAIRSNAPRFGFVPDRKIVTL